MTGPLIPRAASTGWMTEAACREGGVDPEVFFHPSSTGEAMRICLECPVQSDCYTYASSLEYAPLGVWGGVDFSARQARQYELLPTHRAILQFLQDHDQGGEVPQSTFDILQSTECAPSDLRYLREKFWIAKRTQRRWVLRPRGRAKIQADIATRAKAKDPGSQYRY
jgi:hypothetical protein